MQMIKIIIFVYGLVMKGKLLFIKGRERKREREIVREREETKEQINNYTTLSMKL